jgi:predicted nucleic acid-binding Zn ribbon protein
MHFDRLKGLRKRSKRPLIVVFGAIALGLAIALILNSRAFRNRLSDMLLVEALILIASAWLSFLKSNGLAFIIFHPFKKKEFPDGWKDRVPNLGSPPPLFQEYSEHIDASQAQEKEKSARLFQSDLAWSGGVLFAIGLIVQYW